MEKVILLLSDYQLLFGIAILVAGYWKHCSISVYHFSLIIDLAWFSNTHMTSLSVMKCYLQEHRSLRTWRVCIMIIMLIMMLVAIFLASSTPWDLSLSCPAQCVFKEAGTNMRYTYAYIIVLTQHYATSIWRVYDTPRFDKYFLVYPRDLARRTLITRKRQCSSLDGRTRPRFDKYDFLISLRQWVIITLIYFYLSIGALAGSMTVSLYYDIVWFSIGLVSIKCNRSIPPSDMIGNENQLNFGQIVTILMLASILLTFKEVYEGIIFTFLPCSISAKHFRRAKFRMVRKRPGTWPRHNRGTCGSQHQSASLRHSHAGTPTKYH